MSTFLPKDTNENVIPALRLRTGGAHSMSASASSARNATGFHADTRVISIYSDVALYIKFGDNTITAASSDHYFPADLYYDFAIGGDDTGHYTNLAVLRVSENGTVYISEKD